MKQFVTGMALGMAAGTAAGALGMSSLSHAQQRQLKKAAAEAARTRRGPPCAGAPRRALSRRRSFPPQLTHIIKIDRFFAGDRPFPPRFMKNSEISRKTLVFLPRRRYNVL